MYFVKNNNIFSSMLWINMEKDAYRSESEMFIREYRLKYMLQLLCVN